MKINFSEINRKDRTSNDSKYEFILLNECDDYGDDEGLMGRNLISMKLFLRWIDRVSPFGVVVQLDEYLGPLCIISMRLICGRGLHWLDFFVKYF